MHQVVVRISAHVLQLCNNYAKQRPMETGTV